MCICCCVLQGQSILRLYKSWFACFFIYFFKIWTHVSLPLCRGSPVAGREGWEVCASSCLLTVIVSVCTLYSQLCVGFKESQLCVGFKESRLCVGFNATAWLLGNWALQAWDELPHTSWHISAWPRLGTVSLTPAWHSQLDPSLTQAAWLQLGTVSLTSAWHS